MIICRTAANKSVKVQLYLMRMLQAVQCRAVQGLNNISAASANLFYALGLRVTEVSVR